MNTHDIDTGLPHVAFCRVSDVDPHDGHHRQLGVSADTRLYTEDQVRAAIEAALRSQYETQLQVWRSTDSCGEFWSWDEVDQCDYDRALPENRRVILIIKEG